jgi:fermentation-respiration switch protein FrsA (DUF1100 family)
MPISPHTPYTPRRSLRPWLRRSIAATAAVVLLATSACSDQPERSSADDVSSSNIAATAPPERAEVFEVNTFGVGSLAERRVDESRPTMAHGGVAELPQRTMGATVYYPADGPPVDEVTPDAPASKEGPFPLLVFSHGVGHSGPTYKAKLQKIASAGYVIVAATHPLSNEVTQGGATIDDAEQQSVDLSFLIDEYLAESAAPTGSLSGLIAPERLGAFGHSLGAITALGVGFEDCCADKRLKAVAEWSGLFLPMGADGRADLADGSEDRPLLVVHGDKDATVPYQSGQDFFAKAPGAKYFVTLTGGDHIIPFITGLEPPASAVTTLTTVDFFDRYLKNDPKGIDRLEAAVAATPGVATLQGGEQ